MPKNRQPSLFNDAAASPQLSLVEALGAKPPSGKAQLEFQKLVTQIETQRNLLKTWKDYLSRYQLRVSQEILPLQEQLWQEKRRLLLVLEDAYLRPKEVRGKRLRATLHELLVNLSHSLLLEKEDAELRAFYERYEENVLSPEEDLELSKAMLESMFGVSLGDDHGATDLDGLMRKVFEQGEAAQNDAAPKQKRPSRKAQIAEAKREQAAQEVSQTVREVFRKLTSALHPDRAVDEAEKARRTELMQRVNQAYDAGDLLSLLNLQLEIEQIDATHLANLSAERQAHYNQVMREQLAELKAEIAQICSPFYGVRSSIAQLTPKQVDQQINHDIALITRHIKETQADRAKFKDIKAVISYLKIRQEEENSFDPMDDDFSQAMFEELFNPPRAAKASPRGKRRKR